MGEVTISVTKTTTHSSSRSSTCPAARRCDIGLIVWIFTLIAGALCVFGGVLAICDTDFGRAWILFFFQCMFGLIILGNEIPVLFLLKHMPTLSSYEFKGFFLIFVATFMFGGGGTWRDNSTWAGWLVDFCGVVLVVKGAICILLWLGKETCCTKCLGNEIEHVAGAIHVQHTVLHEQSVIVTTNDHIAKCPSWCTVACTIQCFTGLAALLVILSGAFGIADGIGGEDNDTAWWRAFILYFYQIVFGLILLGVEFEIPVVSGFVTKHLPTLRGTWEFKGFFLIFMAAYVFGSGGNWRDDHSWSGFFVDLCGVVLLVKGIFCLILWVGKDGCCPSMVRNNFRAVAGRHGHTTAAPAIQLMRC